MTTMNDIRNDLINVFNKLRDGTMDAKEAVEINNTAGKIISSAKVQLAYAALRGEKPDIEFLRGSDVPSINLRPEEVGEGRAALPRSSAPSVTTVAYGKAGAGESSESRA